MAAQKRRRIGDESSQNTFPCFLGWAPHSSRHPNSWPIFRGNHPPTGNLWGKHTAVKSQDKEPKPWITAQNPQIPKICAKILKRKIAPKFTLQLPSYPVAENSGLPFLVSSPPKYKNTISLICPNYGAHNCIYSLKPNHKKSLNIINQRHY